MPISSWKEVEEKKFVTVLHPFKGKGLHQLPLERGEYVEVLEETTGWYRGRIVFSPGYSAMATEAREREESEEGGGEGGEGEEEPKRPLGIFPGTYVVNCTEADMTKAVRLQRQMGRARSSTFTVTHSARKHFKEMLVNFFSKDPLLLLVSKTVIKWKTLLDHDITEGEFARYDLIRHLLSRLIVIHSKLRSELSTSAVRNPRSPIRTAALEVINVGRQLLGFDMHIYNQQAVLLDETNTPFMRLYNLHSECSEKSLFAKDKAQAEASTGKGTKHIPIVKQKRKLSSKLHQSVHSSVQKGQVHAHLIVEFRALICAKISGTKPADIKHVTFYLYDAESQMQVSEAHTIKVGVSGMTDASKSNEEAAVFVNIPVSLWTSGRLWLISCVTQLAKLQPDHRGEFLRRPGCIAATPVSRIQQLRRQSDYSFELFESVTESYFSRGSKLMTSSKLPFTPIDHGVVVTSCNLVMSTLEQLREKDQLPSDSVELRLIDKQDLLNTQTKRNDIYVTLREGIFPQDRKYNSFEVVVSLRSNKTGDLVADALTVGGGKLQSLYKSLVFYHQSNPEFDETIKVQLPHNSSPRDFHVHFCIRQWSSKDRLPEQKLAGALLLTNESRALLPDGEHTVSILKAKANSSKLYYLAEDAVAKTDAPKLKVFVRAVSSTNSQHPTIVQLLEAKSNPGGVEVGTLKDITFAPVPDVIQFLVPIFEALLVVMAKNRGLKVLAYNTLVFALSILIDDKTDRYAYIRQDLRKFLAGRCCENREVHEPLVQTVNYYMNKLDSTSHAKYLRWTLRALPYLYTVMYNTLCGAVRDEPSEREMADFREQVWEVMDSIITLLQLDDPLQIAPQTTALRSCAELMPLLATQFSTNVTEVVCRLIEALPVHKSKTPTLDMERLLLMQAIVSQSFYLQEAESAEQFLPFFTNAMLVFMETHSRKDMVECAYSVSVLLDGLQSKLTPIILDVETKERVFGHLLPLLPRLLQAADDFSYDKGLRLDSISCLLSILEGAGQRLVKGFVENDLSLLLQLTKVLDLACEESFPSTWVAVRLKGLAVVVDVCQVLSDALLVTHEGEVLREHWEAFLLLCLTIVRSRPLQLEGMSKSKRELIASWMATDLRTVALNLFLELWLSVAAHHYSMVFTLVPDVVTVLLSTESPAIRSTTAEIFVSLLDCEFREVGAIPLVSGRTIETLGFISKKEKLPPTMHAFIEELRLAFGGDSPYDAAAQALLQDLEEMAHLLAECQALPKGIEWEDERTAATLKVMEFLKRAGHAESYIVHVHELCRMHESANRLCEAGLTVLLHAKLLEWNRERTLRPLLHFEEESEWRRKERLYLDAISLFDQAKEWERGIGLLKSLVEEYERGIPDYRSICDLLMMQGAFYKRVTDHERYAPEYFRVSFYGGGFPKTLRGQHVVYRGFEFERITAFIARMAARFPNASICNAIEDLKEADKTGPGQMLLIITVQVSSQAEMDGEALAYRSEIPAYIRKYEKTNDVSVFSFIRALNKGDGNDIKDLWSKVTFLVTEETFPGILSRSKVVASKTVERSPIETAVVSIQQKNMQINDAVNDQLDQHSSASLDRLTMPLNGVIDAAVNGGIRLYRQAFFTEEYACSFPGARLQLAQLQTVLEENVAILDRALRLHAEKCPENLVALQEKMTVMFTAMEEDIKLTAHFAA